MGQAQRSNLPEIEKKKFLVPGSMLLGYDLTVDMLTWDIVTLSYFAIAENVGKVKAVQLLPVVL